MFPTDVLAQIVVTHDPAGDGLVLYVDGVRHGSEAATALLSDMVDHNNWLTRSNFANDDNLAGGFDDVRIFDVALTDEEVALAFTRGPARAP